MKQLRLNREELQREREQNRTRTAKIEADMAELRAQILHRPDPRARQDPAPVAAAEILPPRMPVRDALFAGIPQTLG